MRLAKNIRPEDLGIGRLFERVPDAVIVADAWTQQIVLWNSAAERVFGYSTSEALELRVEALVPGALKDRHRAGMARYSETGRGTYIDSHQLLELPALTKSGEEIQIELSLSPIGLVEEANGGDDGRFVLAIVRDITERKRAEEARLRSEERYRAVVEQALEGIFLVDVDTKRILEANGAYQRLLGYDFEELMELTLYDVVAHDRLSIDLYVRRILEAKSYVIGERQHLRKDGLLVDIVASASTISYGDREAISIIVHDISERKRAEERLWESEDRYRRLVELSPETIAVHSEGKFIYVNAAGAKLFGATEAEELIGKPFLDFVHPDYVELVKARVQRTLEGNTAELTEIKIMCLDGETIDVEATGMPIVYGGFSAVQVVIRDITERKRAEEELQVSEAKLRSLFEAMNDVILVLDAQGRYLDIAPTNPSLLYRTPEDLLGKTLHEVFPQEQADAFFERIQQALETQQTVNMEYRLLIGEEEVWFDSAISPMLEDSVIFVARDISERKRAEEKLREANRRLGEVAALRADFTAMVAHDLGSPLATIRAFLEMLATGELEPAEEADVLANIRAEVDKLSTLAADVRSAAAIERKDFALVPRRMPISDLLKDAAQFVKTLPGDHPLTVEVSAKEWVWADPYRIGQVLRNLLSNAIKYSPNGAPLKLRAIYGKTPERVRIEVTDQGFGIHPDDAERIFEKFGRGRDRSGGKAYGVGLGLYISRRIVRAHGGELKVDPAPDGGSVFWFELEVVR